MRGKRAKQYRKLMHQYELNFGFREPYQVLLDDRILQDADSCKMDLVGGLERTLHGKVKPLISQCTIRHLYELKKGQTQQSSDPTQASRLISAAKSLERRRCNHHTLPEPLPVSTCIFSCLSPASSTEVVSDPSASVELPKNNKFRYIVATQDPAIRRALRNVPGVPLVYIKRSVMVLEPMANSTAHDIEQEEKGKLKEGIRSKGKSLGKRKRDETEDDKSATIDDKVKEVRKKKKARGQSGPNPLSVKKPKSRPQPQPQPQRDAHVPISMHNEGEKESTHLPKQDGDDTDKVIADMQAKEGETPAKSKRRRKHRSKRAGDIVGNTVEEASSA